MADTKSHPQGLDLDTETKIAARVPGPPDPQDVAAGYERSDLSVRGAVFSGILLLVSVVVVFFVVTGAQWATFGTAPDLTPPEAGIADPPQAPVPESISERAATGSQYRTLRATEDQLIMEYSWLDQEAGVVRIPVSRAMELLAERGLPTRPEGELSAGMDAKPPLRLDSSSGRFVELPQEGSNQ